MVHNHREFEEVIQPYFFQSGATVIVDFGWSHMGSTFDDSAFYDPNDFSSIDGIITQKIDRLEEMMYGVGHKYNSDYIPGIVRDKNWLGRVNINVGNVINFSAKLDENNSYQCTLEICSRNTALASKEISEDNGLSYLFGNSMDSIIKNVYADVSDIDINAGKNLDDDEAGKAAEAAIESLQGGMAIVGGLVQDDPVAVSQERERAILAGTYRPTGLVGDDPNSPTLLGPVIPAEQYEEMSSKALEETINAVELMNGGKISAKDKQYGIHDDEGVFYISYGMLEDVYLNVFLTPTVDEKENFNRVFNSRGQYLRFDQTFLDIQKCKLSGNEKRNVFKIPANWYGTYNSLVMGKNATQVEHEKNGLFSLEYFNDEGEYVLPETTDGAVDLKDPLYGVPIIPIRDLFLQVEFISKVFRGTTSVSDALQTIWNTVSLQSCDVWNILISSTHDVSNTSISFQDVNLTKKNIRDVYEFDVTSHNSIVVNNDITFQIPKDKISAAVAMRNLSGPEAVKSKDLRELMDFIQISPSVEGDAKQFWKSIPTTGETNLRADKEVGVVNKNGVGVA